MLQKGIQPDVNPASALNLQNRDQTVFFPASLDEATAYSLSHPEAGIICVFSLLSGLTDTSSSPDKVFLDLAGVDELNFFYEDHGWWFLGAALTEQELLEISRERLPELYNLLSNSDRSRNEPLIQWFIRHHCRIHVSDQGVMKILECQHESDLRTLVSGGGSRIPCMISIPKK
jgi:hypothetical protein